MLLEGIDQFKERLSLAQAQSGRLATNCTLSMDALTRAIERGEMHMLGGGAQPLFLLCEHDGFYELYYYFDLEAPSEPPPLPGDKPVLISLIAAGKAQAEEERGFFLMKGFRPYATAGRFVRALNEADGQGERPARLTHAEIRQVEAALKREFDLFTDQIPSGEALRCAQEEGRLFGNQDGDGRLRAFALVERNRRCWTLTHIAVHPERRGQGLGKMLLRQTLCEGARQGVSRVYAWIHQGNDASERMHRSEGFCPDGRIAYKLILQR